MNVIDNCNVLFNCWRMMSILRQLIMNKQTPTSIEVGRKISNQQKKIILSPTKKAFAASKFKYFTFQSFRC